MWRSSLDVCMHMYGILSRRPRRLLRVRSEIHVHVRWSGERRTACSVVWRGWRAGRAVPRDTIHGEIPGMYSLWGRER